MDLSDLLTITSSSANKDDSQGMQIDPDSLREGPSKQRQSLEKQFFDFVHILGVLCLCHSVNKYNSQLEGTTSFANTVYKLYCIQCQ